MSQYLRDIYRRRRQEEHMMFQRIAAEEAQIQKFLLLQQADGDNLFIGGEVTNPTPPPFVNPTLTIGTSVSIVPQSPFSGDNSYSLIHKQLVKDSLNFY